MNQSGLPLPSLPNRTLLSLAITTALLPARVGATESADTDSSNHDAIAEITVTAQRRSENLQDVPIAIQALTSDSIEQLHIENFDDAVKYLPNVTTAGLGPGQNNIIVRGLSIGSEVTQGSGAVGQFPNVAVYLDEQSVTLPGRNLDIYTTDIERIEVLEGPQGTLFGGGAQAGVIRYITNKPKLDVTQGNVDAGYAVTAHGAPGSNGSAMINIPVIADTLAVRAVIYDDRRGGYIDNVPGTFVRLRTDPGIHYAGYVNNVPGPATPTNSANNNNLVASDINPVTYSGIRASALLKVDDDWNALLTQSYQNMDAEGVFFETPISDSGTGSATLPPLSVQLYTPSYDKDRFENTALTVNGKLGPLHLVYAGAYLVRNVEQVQDYTAYARSTYADYYQCTSRAQTGNAPQCYSPVGSWHDRERDLHQSHELRISTTESSRIRPIGGVFWENYAIHDETNWLYRTAPGFTDIAPAPGASVNDPSVRNSNTSFFDDVTRGYTQTAVFGSVDIDILPKRLTLSAGTRYYRFNESEVGSAGGSFGCYAEPVYPCTVGQANLGIEGLRHTYTGFRSRANLTWKITPDVMVYYTWSQGFRPGGFNRSSFYSEKLDYSTPISFAPDTLTNNEIGWKTQWWDQRLRVDGAVYQENWKNIQDTFFDPGGGLGNLAFFINGPDYRVRGVETQITVVPVSGLTIYWTSAWNSSDQLTSPGLYSNTGAPITSITNPYGEVGDTLAQSPPFQAALRARYEFIVGDYHAFVQAGGQHQAHSHSSTGFQQDFDQAGYTSFDASIGVAKDAWSAQFYGTNLTDVRADLYHTASEVQQAEVVSRPRTLGVKFSYAFKGL